MHGAGFTSPDVFPEHASQEGLEGDRGHLVRGHLMGLGFDPRQAAAQIDEKEIQGNRGVQLHGVPLLAGDQVADLEHLGIGEFVHQPPQVVEGAAKLRGEFRGLGVHQVQGQDKFGYLPQGLIDRGVFQVGFPGRLADLAIPALFPDRRGRCRRPP